MDKWEAKELYVQRKNMENEKIESLTPEQHWAIQELCAIRHKTHCKQDTWFYDEASEHNYFWNYIENANGESTLNIMLSSVGLPNIEFDIDIMDYNTSLMCTELSLDKEVEYIAIIEMANVFNKKIEDYLMLIDKEHKTSYCPTGFARLM